MLVDKIVKCKALRKSTQSSGTLFSRLQCVFLSSSSCLMILARTLAYLQRTLSSIMPSSEKRVACVTGASSGIGRATALEFARHNFHLSLSGRDEKALEAVVAECKKAGAAEVCFAVFTIYHLGL